MVTKSESNSDEMTKLVDTSDVDGIEDPIEGNALVARRYLSILRWMMWSSRFIFHTRGYVNKNLV